MIGEEEAGRARARLAILVPDLVKGVHAAIATIVPFYFAATLREPALAWVALGGWLGSLADPGGHRRTRAIAALSFIAFGGAAVAVAKLAAATTPSAALVLGAIVFAASLAPALGSSAGGVGTVIAIAAGIAASQPGSPVDGALFAVGAAWAAVSSMLMWPVLPHLPMRVAVGRVFDRLADYVDAMAAAQPGDWPDLGRTHQRAVRGAIEQARATALAVRARRTGESDIGANLRAVIGAAENIFFRAIALAEEVERGRTVPTNLAAALRGVARDLYALRAGPVVPLEGNAPVVDATREVAVVVRDLEHAHFTPVPLAPPPRARRTARELRDALLPRSPIVTHAVRVAILAAVAVTIGRTLTPAHPTWVTVTALAVIQPYLGPTVKRAAERVIGTILGAMLALALLLSVHSPLGLALALFPLSVAAVMTRPRSYRLFVLFLTPVFVLVTDMRGADWHAAAARILDVSIGGALALLAAIIAPSYERPRLADALDGVLDALARYAALAPGNHPLEVIVAARRELGLALEHAEASLERMLAEPAPLRHGEEEAMYLVTYARRVSASMTALLEERVAIPEDVSAYLTAVIDDVRAHFAGRPAPVPRPPPATSPPLAGVVRRGELLAQIAATRRE